MRASVKKQVSLNVIAKKKYCQEKETMHNLQNLIKLAILTVDRDSQALSVTKSYKSGNTNCC